MQQQVPEGYRQTEVGVFPETWEVSIIDNIVARGWLDKPMDGNHGNIHPKSVDFVDYGVPFVMANNVQNGRVDLNGCSFLRKEQSLFSLAYSTLPPIGPGSYPEMSLIPTVLI